MFAYILSTSGERDLEGQSVGRAFMRLNGVYVPVVTLTVAADRLKYSLSWTRQLCAVGTLIAFKIDRRWWVLEWSVERQASTLGHPRGNVS